MTLNDLIVDTERKIIELEKDERLNYEPEDGKEAYVNALIVKYELRRELDVLKRMKMQLLSVKQ